MPQSQSAGAAPGMPPRRLRQFAFNALISSRFIHALARAGNAHSGERRNVGLCWTFGILGIHFWHLQHFYCDAN
jgi:hypothetical protein